MSTGASQALTDLFRDTLVNDAMAVVNEMRTPTILRLRADRGEENHPVLALRLARMGAARARVKRYAETLIEGQPPLETVKQKEQLQRVIEQAYQSSCRVLECTTSAEFLGDVQSTLTAMNHSLGVIHSVMKSRPELGLAEFVQAYRTEIDKLSNNTSVYAERAKAIYENMRVVLAGSGERIYPVDVEEEHESTAKMG